MRTLITLFCLFSIVAVLSAQAKSSLLSLQDDLSAIRSANDAAIKAISPNRGLIEPSKLNPRMADLQKLYYNIDYQKGVLSMTTGDLLAANMRYRLFGQIMEVEYQGGTYAMDLNMVKAFSIGTADFALLPDLLKKKPGRLIYEVHFANEQTLLLQQHWTEEDFRDKLNNVPTADSQLLRRGDDLVLSLDGRILQISNHKTALAALGIEPKSAAAAYVKANKLKLRQAADLAELLAYLAEAN